MLLWNQDWKVFCSWWGFFFFLCSNTQSKVTASNISFLKHKAPCPALFDHVHIVDESENQIVSIDICVWPVSDISVNRSVSLSAHISNKHAADEQKTFSVWQSIIRIDKMMLHFLNIFSVVTVVWLRSFLPCHFHARARRQHRAFTENSSHSSPSCCDPSHLTLSTNEEIDE